MGEKMSNPMWKVIMQQQKVYYYILQLLTLSVHLYIMLEWTMLMDYPKKVAVPLSGEEDYLEDAIGKFIDQYCMYEWEIDEFLRKQATEQQQPDDLRLQPQQPNQQHTQQGAVKPPLPPGLLTL